MTDFKKISQLTLGVELAGTEELEMVQAGNSRKLTSDMLPLRTYPYVTVGSVGLLSQSRQLAAGTGVTLTDGGAGSNFTISLTGGIPAPSTAQYLVLQTDGTLTNERVLTAGTNISFVDGGAGSTLTINASGGGGGSPAGSNTQIQFNNGGSFGADADFTWTSASNVLRVGSVQLLGTGTLQGVPFTGTSIVITGGSGDPAGNVTITGGTNFSGTGGSVLVSGAAGSGANAPGNATYQAGSATTASSANGAICQVRGGNAGTAGTGNGGDLRAVGGLGPVGGTGDGGNLSLEGGLAGTVSGTAGSILFITANTQRAAILGDGTWELAGDPGTSGQQLTSNGPSAAPTWQTGAGGSNPFSDPFIMYYAKNVAAAASGSYTSNVDTGDNTVLRTSGDITQSGGEITLTPGTYFFNVKANFDFAGSFGTGDANYTRASFGPTYNEKIYGVSKSLIPNSHIETSCSEHIAGVISLTVSTDFIIFLDYVHGSSTTTDMYGLVWISRVSDDETSFI